MKNLLLVILVSFFMISCVKDEFEYNERRISVATTQLKPFDYRSNGENDYCFYNTFGYRFSYDEAQKETMRDFRQSTAFVLLSDSINADSVFKDYIVGMDYIHLNKYMTKLTNWPQKDKFGTGFKYVDFQKSQLDTMQDIYKHAEQLILNSDFEQDKIEIEVGKTIGFINDYSGGYIRVLSVDTGWYNLDLYYSANH
jgi:hypothetical protein